MSHTLATFLVLFYVKQSVSDAAILDFNLLKLFEKGLVCVKDDHMLKFIQASLEKLKQHLWYLSERLIPLSLFSSRVEDQQKSELAKEILDYKGEAPSKT